MGRIINKIKDYRIDHSKKETIDWLIVCLKFKLKKLKPASGNFNSIKLSNQEIKNIIINQQRKIFIFANIPYYDIGGGQRSSQLAKTFYKMGFPVYYLYAHPSSESKIHNIPMPMIMHNDLKKVGLERLSSLMNENDLCIFESPCEKFEEYIKLAKEKKAKIVYENIDNWETSLGVGVLHKATLNELLKDANLLVGTAKPLVTQLEEYRKDIKIKRDIKYLANAVDDEMFFPLKQHEKPEDLVIGSKTLIYYGSLWGEWVDWEIVFGVAKANPDYEINLIGDYQGIMNIVTKSPKNVHYLGLKKQEELPAYLKYSDYALLPFKVGKIGDYVSPLKIFEYISMNKIVLATSLPDIKDYPNTYFGDTAEEWNKLLKKNLKVDEQKSDEFVSKNNWYNRTCQILDTLHKNESEKCQKEFYNNISIVVLNYNNKGIIDRCIDSLLRYNKRYSYEIIIVDNKSTDGSLEQIKTKYKDKIKIVENEKNGCSSGRNLGVKNATKEYIIFLDSDQWAMNKYWIEPYFEILNKVPNVGLIGWAAGWFNKYGKAYHVVDSFAYRYMPQSGLCRKDIGYLGSGGMMIKKELFDKVEGFDLFYDPTCYEDTDLSLKIRNEGLEIYYCPYLGVMHLPHQTTKSGSSAHKKLTNEKQEYFTKKWNEKNPDLLKYIK